MLTHAGSSCGKERRALLAGARDACYVAIAGFQEVGEEGMAAQARQMLADVELVRACVLVRAWVCYI